jgi:O-antigen/teichoic acid export membrane protein
MGHFSPWSWWPFVLALGLALMFLGVAAGIWITFIGVPIAAVAIIGWYYEYYRGNFTR